MEAFEEEFGEAFEDARETLIEDLETVNEDEESNRDSETRWDVR